MADSVQVIDRLVGALVSSEQLKFDDFDREALFQVARSMFSEGVEGLDSLLKRLHPEKNILVSEVGSGEFTYFVQGPALYLEITFGTKTQKVVFGPYVPPFTFD